MKNTNRRLVDLLTADELADFINAYVSQCGIRETSLGVGERLSHYLTTTSPEEGADRAINAAFIWKDTKEGHDYWAAISDRILKACFQCNAQDLNANEMPVLRACTTERVEYSPSEDHGFMTEIVSVDGLSKNQIKGYLGQLEKKGYIITCDDCYFSGFISEKGLNRLELPVCDGTL